MFLHIIPILLTLGVRPDCDGFGICIIERETEQLRLECQKYENCIPAELDYKDQEIILTVSTNKIQDKAFVKFFTKTHFEIDLDVPILDDIALAIACPKGTVIVKGSYPIDEQNGKIILRFKP